MSVDSGKETSFKQLIQNFLDKDMDVLQGVVTSESPLKIQIVNDEKLIIGPNITYVPRHLTDYTTTVSLNSDNGLVEGHITNGDRLTSFNFTGLMTVHNSLRKGDRVHLLAFNHGKQYYVLDRV